MNFRIESTEYHEYKHNGYIIREGMCYLNAHNKSVYVVEIYYKNELIYNDVGNIDDYSIYKGYVSISSFDVNDEIWVKKNIGSLNKLYNIMILYSLKDRKIVINKKCGFEFVDKAVNSLKNTVVRAKDELYYLYDIENQKICSKGYTYLDGFIYDVGGGQKHSQYSITTNGDYGHIRGHNYDDRKYGFINEDGTEILDTVLDIAYKPLHGRDIKVKYKGKICKLLHTKQFSVLIGNKPLEQNNLIYTNNYGGFIFSFIIGIKVKNEFR